ncbi:MAG: zinc ribbon domain-containing protein [Acidobacteria bacterium]|nr:MAG: zinc ribbon domain-containing protein [Acidobacteriota bacterium]REK02201.1 MAG: zinc ribbon domain-containing protein [Acidobacteriota bacterium]REK13996.1 MAG: zinc ribbon domain-containing protein [Acidobacteriota bacterium]REK41991.1 MAG: zinc ribbon domain-containing protein [Acidobacteriota bacterium]
MFCPKCGTENPEEGKFCRKCGTDISGVSRAIGSETHTGMDLMGLGDESELLSGDSKVYGVVRAGSCETSNDPDDLFASGLRSSIFGVGFLVISAVLYFTHVAGGGAWWWAMLFPAFAMLASGVGNIAKSKRMERKLGKAKGQNTNAFTDPASQRSISEGNADYVSSGNSDRFETGDLVPPSVVENTTKHLKLDKESETMTLPDLETSKKS